MPIDLSRYPSNWRDFALQVKAAAGWRCEQCRHPHAPKVGYSLTVHHIDGNPRNSCTWNLVALCQRCHLSLHRRQLVGQFWFEFAKPAWMRRRDQERIRAAALVRVTSNSVLSEGAGGSSDGALHLRAGDTSSCSWLSR